MRFNSNYACLLSPFAYLCTRPPPRSVSAVQFGQRRPNCFSYIVTDHILNFGPLNILDANRTTTTVVHRSSSATGRSSRQCDFYGQPGGQQLLQY